jgi:hypothetical protein
MRQAHLPYHPHTPTLLVVLHLPCQSCFLPYPAPIDTDNQYSSAHRDPNTLIRVAREQPWALQHASDVRGARDAFVYLDYANQPVHVAFGAGERRSAKEWMRPVTNTKNKGDVKAFTSLSLGTTGGEYKWRIISADKMEVSIFVFQST